MSERFERLLVSPSLFIVLFPDKSLTNQITVLFLQTLYEVTVCRVFITYWSGMNIFYEVWR